MKNRLATTLIFLFGLYLIISFSRDLVGLLQKGKEIEKFQLKLEKSLTENRDLKKQLEYVNTFEFVEKEAREKLGMSKEGETVIILPENIKELANRKEEKKEDVPIWKQWVQLFGFYK